MTPTTREVAAEAIEYRLDCLRDSIRTHRSTYYSKGTWRGDMHRGNVARELRELRNALRELKPRTWPRWYSSDPLAAYQREGR